MVKQQPGARQAHWRALRASELMLQNTAGVSCRRSARTRMPDRSGKAKAPTRNTPGRACRRVPEQQENGSWAGSGIQQATCHWPAQGMEASNQTNACTTGMEEMTRISVVVLKPGHGTCQWTGWRNGEEIAASQIGPDRRRWWGARRMTSTTRVPGVVERGAGEVVHGRIDDREVLCSARLGGIRCGSAADRLPTRERPGSKQSSSSRPQPTPQGARYSATGGGVSSR